MLPGMRRPAAPRRNPPLSRSAACTIRKGSDLWCPARLGHSCCCVVPSSLFLQCLRHRLHRGLDAPSLSAPMKAPLRPATVAPEDATRTQNSMFEIRNLRKPRELSQPNQLDMVGERGFEPPTPWSRKRD